MTSVPFQLMELFVFVSAFLASPCYWRCFGFILFLHHLSMNPSSSSVLVPDPSDSEFSSGSLGLNFFPNLVILHSQAYSCRGSIWVLVNKLSHFLAVTGFQYDRFGVSQVFWSKRCFHLILFLQLYQKKVHCMQKRMCEGFFLHIYL